MEHKSFGRRAILKKTGSGDMRVEVHRNSAYEFSTVENGIPTGIVSRRLTPQEAMRGDGPAPMELDEAWRTLLSKYPDYTVTALEDAFPVEDGK